MGIQWTSKELRVELGTEEKRMVFRIQLRDFHESAVGRYAGKDKACFDKLIYIFWIHFITVPVAFIN